MGRLSWITWVGPVELQDPYKREGKGQSKASVTIAVERDWKMLHWLLTLKMEGGAISQGVQAPSRSWKRKRTSFSPSISRRNAVLMIRFELLTDCQNCNLIHLSLFKYVCVCIHIHVCMCVYIYIYMSTNSWILLPPKDGA